MASPIVKPSIAGTAGQRMFLLAGTAVVVASLYFARDVLIPCALAVLFSFLLAPLVTRLERWRVGRVSSVLVVVVGALVVISLLSWLVAHQLNQLVKDLPGYSSTIRDKTESIRARLTHGSINQAGANLTTQPAQPAAIPVHVVEPPDGPLTVIEKWASPVLSTLATAGIVVVFIIFMLIQREDLRDRVIRLVGKGQVNVTTQAMDDAGQRVSRYLAMQALLNGTFGLCVGAGLYFIDVPQFALWGLLGALLRFVPYIGPWLAAAMPLLLSVAISKTWTMPAETLTLFVVLELTVSQFLEPWLYGSSTGISALAILVAAVFWTWLWGPIGLLLSTPLTVVLVVIGKYVPQLEFLNIILGSEPVLEPPARLYQRLLAQNQEEAEGLLEELARDMDVTGIFENVMLPALVMSEQDRHGGLLSQDQATFIDGGMRRLVDDVVDARREIEARVKPAGPPAVAAIKADGEVKMNILCLPAHDEADEIACLMLGRLLELAGFGCVTVSVTALAAEMVQKASEHHADLICIMAVPPDAAIYARYLCKRVSSTFPDREKILGVIAPGIDIVRLRGRLRCGEDQRVVTTLTDAVEMVRQLAHAHAVKPEEPDRMPRQAVTAQSPAV